MVDKELIRRYSLTNASEHMGKANAKSVLSNILGDNPKLRKNVMEIKSEVEEEVKKINKWSEKKQKKELEKLGKIEKEEKKEKKELPEMVGAKRGEFVVRFAPNPNGPLHLGSARPAVINHEYTKKYDGKFILRFDDTDPVTKVPKKKFYKMIEEDLNWLGIEPDEVYRASNRLDKYKEYAIKAIEEGLAYVCTCERKEWSKKKNKGIACPCRDNSVKKNKKRWKKMVEHKFKEGQATLKIKTDLEEKNPAVRDWTAYRIVEESKHPYDKKEHLWPLYNFQSAIDDHLLGTTHILRGQEHSTNESKQQYLYKAFEWDYPVTVVMGRFNLQGMDLSTSKIREKIKKRELYGWDDLRTGTLRALKRRGFHPEAIHHLVMKIGNKPSDITISIENLASINRKLIDSEANRYFFVSDPVKITLDKRLKKSLTLPAHPDKPKGEKRKFRITKTMYIDKKDFERYKGLEVRLKDLFNIKLGKNQKAEATSKKVKNIPKIHWVPSKHIIARVAMKNKRIEGYAEDNLRGEDEGNMVQFERFGFVRVENKTDKNVSCVFGHR